MDLNSKLSPSDRHFVPSTTTCATAPGLCPGALQVQGREDPLGGEGDPLGAQHPRGGMELHHRQILEDLSTRVVPDRTEEAQLSGD